VRLIVNARVECSPEHLDQLVRDALVSTIDGRYTDEVTAWRYLQPGRPNPTHRFQEFVESLARGEGNFFAKRSVSPDGSYDYFDGWMKNPMSAMISCNDGFRPFSFYLEVI
jgi:hypothetical protein